MVVWNFAGSFGVESHRQTLGGVGAHIFLGVRTEWIGISLVHLVGHLDGVYLSDLVQGFLWRGLWDV